MFQRVFVAPRWGNNGLSLVYFAIYLNKALCQMSPKLSMDLAAGMQHMRAAFEEMERGVCSCRPRRPWIVDISDTLKSPFVIGAFESLV